MDLSETIVVYDLKLATDDWSDKKFLLTLKRCPVGGCMSPATRLYTVKPVIVANSAKQATCIKRPVFRFLITTNKYKCTSTKQAPALSLRCLLNTGWTVNVLNHENKYI